MATLPATPGEHPVGPAAAESQASLIFAQDQAQGLDKKQQFVEGLISSLPLVRHLRSGPGRTKYKESHLHNNLHPDALATHLVSGSLAGRDKLPVDPFLFVRTDPDSACRVISVLYIGTHLCGHPGYVHGGLPFALFDDIFARCAGTVFGSGVGMTANLNMHFRKPCIPGRVYVIRAEIARREGRKIWLNGRMLCLAPFTSDEMARESEDALIPEDMSEQEKEGALVVEADALFIEPKFADSMVSLFQDRS